MSLKKIFKHSTRPQINNLLTHSKYGFESDKKISDPPPFYSNPPSIRSLRTSYSLKWLSQVRHRVLRQSAQRSSLMYITSFVLSETAKNQSFKGTILEQEKIFLHKTFSRSYKFGLNLNPTNFQVFKFAKTLKSHKIYRTNCRVLYLQ